MQDVYVWTAVVSTCFQIAAAIIALRLVASTGNKSAWLYIAIAFAVMVTHRVIVVGSAYWSVKTFALEELEFVSLLVSILLFVGVRSIREFVEKARAADQTYRESQERLRSIFELPLVGIATLDADCRWVQMNDKLCTMLGSTREDIIGRAITEFAHPDYREELCAAMDKLVQGSVDGATMESRFVRKDGATLCAGLSFRCVRNGTNAPVYIVAILNDVTELKRGEEAREELLEKLQREVSKVKALSGLLPICASCKKIRDDTGYWNQVETYLVDHAEMSFSHGICPDCARKMYPEVFGPPQPDK